MIQITKTMTIAPQAQAGKVDFCSLMISPIRCTLNEPIFTLFIHRLHDISI